MEMVERKSNLSHINGPILVSPNSQLTVSSGIPALDEILGGGLPVGTVTLIEEDMYGKYSRTMLKYFVAEGVVSKHSIFIASQDSSPHEVMREIPAVIKSDPEKLTNANQKSDSKMKIAFRYENLPTHNNDKIDSIGHFFDLSKTMPIEDVENTDICYWNGMRLENGTNTFSNPAYNDLLKSIKDKIKENRFFLKDNPSKKAVLRIGIHSLGSPLWLPHKSGLHSLDCSRDLDMFIFCLRALVRSALAVAVVTIPSHLYHENALERCIHSSDISMRLQTFAGTELENNKSLMDYHGFFYLTKLAPINSLASKHPGSVEYVFKLRRKKFVIEKLHLPPDFDDDGDDNKKSKSSCGCTNKLLEF